MNPDKIETYLSQRPGRELPASWREEILRAASEGGERQAFESSVREKSWFSPHVNWAALAAAWVMIGILALNSDESGRGQKASAAAFVRMHDYQRERDRVLAELTGEGRQRAEPKPETNVAPGRSGNRRSSVKAPQFV